MRTIVIQYDPEQTGHQLGGEDESGRLGDLLSYLREHFNDKRIVSTMEEVEGEVYPLDDREHAMTLAGLRCYQANMAPDEDLQNIATNFGTVEPLSDDEIDELCERLNCVGEAQEAPDLVPNAPLDLIRMAIAEIRRARDSLRLAGAVKAADYVRRALKSAQGAERHAELAPYREQRQRAGRG